MKLPRLKMLHKKPEVVFLLIAIPFGLLSAIFTPQISVTDEDSHFLRAYQVAHGEYVCATSTLYPEDVINKSKAGSYGLRDYNADYSDIVTDSVDKKYTCGSARSYSPLSYIPQATGVFIAEATHPSAALMVLFGRVLNLIAYIGIIYFVIKRVNIGKYVFFVLALTPQLIHLAASLSSDAMNNAITFAVIGITFNLFTQTNKITKKQITLLILLAGVAAILKQTLFLLLIPLIFLPARIFPKNNFKKFSLPFNARKWIFSGVCFMVAALSFLTWSSLTKIQGVDSLSQLHDTFNSPFQFIKLLFNTYLSDYGDIVLRGMFGDFSSFLFHLPAGLVVLQIVFILLAGLAAYDRRDVRSPSLCLVLASIGTLVVSILVITYGLYMEWALKKGTTLYASGVQGRYFTALLLLVIPLMLWLRQYIAITVRSRAMLFWVLVAGQVFLLAYYMFLLAGWLSGVERVIL